MMVAAIGGQTDREKLFDKTPVKGLSSASSNRDLRTSC